MAKNTHHAPAGQHRFTQSTPAELSDPLVAEWRTWLRGAKRREPTIARRVYVVERFARESGVSCVSACHTDVSGWFAANDGWSSSTVALYHECLNVWFCWLVQMEYRSDNPMAKVGKPARRVGEPRPVSDSDLVRMLSVRMHRRTRVMILLAALAGLRASEVSKVKGEDIDVGRGVIWVDGKGGKRRSVPLHPRLVSAAEAMPSRGWWFPGRSERTGRHISSAAVTTLIGRVMRRAGAPGTPHSLRHYFASALFSSGTDVLTVSKLLRHESVATTQIYTAVPDASRHEAVARLDPWQAHAKLVRSSADPA